MNCHTFRAQHVAFVDLVLTDDNERAMSEHCETCASCARFDTSVRRGLLVARNLPDVRLSPAFKSRLDARLRDSNHDDIPVYASDARRQPPSLWTTIAIAAGLIGMVYVTRSESTGPMTAGVTAAAIAETRDIPRDRAPAHPALRIYSAPLRSPAVVTVISTASNTEWMSPTPSVATPSAFAPVTIETVAFVR